MRLMPASVPSDNHGLVRPWAQGNMFQLERIEPSAGLRRIIERHWVVRWDLRGREPFRQEILPHPSTNLVVEPDQSWVWGVPTKRDSRMLEGIGWAVGTKFQPGAFTACTGIDAVRLTNTASLSTPPSATGSTHTTISRAPSPWRSNGCSLHMPRSTTPRSI
jgi:hypothetical protein